MYAYYKSYQSYTESRERILPLRKVGSSNPSRVKPMTSKIDTCHYLVWCLADRDKGWLAQYY